MRVGDTVRVKPRVWAKFTRKAGGSILNSLRTVVSTTADGKVLLNFPPLVAWDPEEIEPMDENKKRFERLFHSIMEMWGRRYDTDCDSIPGPTEGKPFGCPVAVDLGALAVAQSEALALSRYFSPELYAEWSGFPAQTIDSAKIVLDPKDRQLRRDREFDSEAVAYIEALWGKETFAFDAAVRDLEGMRRGSEDKELRPPETDYEAELLVRHVRDLANEMARLFGQVHLIRPEDDIRKKVEEG